MPPLLLPGAGGSRQTGWPAVGRESVGEKGAVVLPVHSCTSLAKPHSLSPPALQMMLIVTKRRKAFEPSVRSIWIGPRS